MKPINIWGRTIEDVDKLKIALAVRTSERVISRLYPIFIIDEDSVNEILSQHQRDIEEFASKLPDSEPITKDQLQRYSEYLSQARVNGQDYLGQRDRIAEQVVHQVTPIVKESSDPLYGDENFLTEILSSSKKLSGLLKKINQPSLL